MVKESKFAWAGEIGTVDLKIETKDSLTPEVFDTLISEVKKRYPELSSEPETEEEEPANEKKSPERMNQKEFNRWREIEEKKKRAAKPKPW